VPHVVKTVYFYGLARTIVALDVNGDGQLLSKPACYRVPAAGGVSPNIIDIPKWLSPQIGNYSTILSL
jgi:hypothetical protein